MLHLLPSPDGSYLKRHAICTGLSKQREKSSMWRYTLTNTMISLLCHVGSKPSFKHDFDECDKASHLCTHSRPSACFTYLLHFLPGRQQSRHHLGTVLPRSTKSAIQTVVRPRSVRTPRAIQHTAWSYYGKQHLQENRRNRSHAGWTEKPAAVSSTKHSPTHGLVSWWETSP